MRHDSPPKILVIDDKAPVRLNISAHLKDYGYEVTEAENSQTGLTVFQREAPDLVLLSLQMSEGNGTEVLATVTATAPEVPLIVFSGAEDIRSNVVEALRRGAWDYFLWPVKEMAVLLHRVREALERVRLMKENRLYREHLKTEVTRRTQSLEKANRELRREISGREETEKKLRKSEKILEAIIRSVPDIIYRLDPAGRISFVSDAVKKYGYTPEALIGKNILEIVHPEDRHIARFHIDERRTGNRRPRKLEIRLVDKKGDNSFNKLRISDFPSELVFLVEAEGLYDSELPKTETFLGTQGVARDITPRKQAEAALKESQARFQRLAESVQDMFYRMTLPEGRYEFVSPAAETLFGYTPEEFYNTPNLVLKTVHPDWRESVERQWRQLSEGHTPLPHEYKIRHRSGGERWMFQRDVLIRDENGQTVAAEGIITDMTERRQLEAQLRQSQKMEAIGTLAGGIAHDFNNILTAIMGNAELLNLAIPEDNAAHRKVSDILRASQRARELVMQILAFSRRGEQTRKPVRFSLILGEALKLLKASLPSTIEIREEIASDADTILADPTQIHQVIMNLCTNASHAMKDGGGILRIALASIDIGADAAPISPPDLMPGKWIRLSVSDTGRGIPPDILERIFDPYFTTKEKDMGTGLGLAVVLGIVRNHSGTIQVCSQPGKGSVFGVFLPRIETVAEVGEALSAPPPPGGKERILFVDDEEMLTYLGSNLLESLGYKVVTETRPEEALALFSRDPISFDLVITDMTMPGMTGDVLARELRRIRPDLPIILCSGFNEALTEEKTKAAGIQAFLTKPYKLSIFAETIRQVLTDGKNIQNKKGSAR